MTQKGRLKDKRVKSEGWNRVFVRNRRSFQKRFSNKGVRRIYQPETLRRILGHCWNHLEILPYLVDNLHNAEE